MGARVRFKERARDRGEIAWRREMGERGAEGPCGLKMIIGGY